jgi:hypothetical protein
MSKTKTVKRSKEVQRKAKPQDAAVKTKEASVKPDVAATTPYAAADGICVTCVHRAKCLFLKAARRPIMFCDEFSNEAIGTQQYAPEGEQLVDGHNYEQGPPPSICVNCDNRLTCMHRKPDEPVLECEDYQ